MRALCVLAALASLAFGAVVVLPEGFAPTVLVPERYLTIQSAIDAAPDGAAIHIGPGTFLEHLDIAKPLALIGAPNGATRVDAKDAAAVITVRNTRGVRIEGLTVAGGEYGILVDESEAVQLIANQVIDARFVGIRLSRASALLKANKVRGATGPYGMGIELANTISRPASLITGNTVTGATQEGIILHNAHATIQANTVTSNGLRGVSINEMSMALVWKNKISDNADAGIHVMDSSMAEIDGNQISRVRPGPEGKADGIRAFYYAEVMLGRNNRIEIDPDHAIVATFGATVERR